MNVTCQVIQDLLPLYAEHLTSEDTCALVEEHLEGCPACRARLQAMQAPPPVPADQDLTNLETFRDRILLRRERMAALISILVMVAFFSTCNFFSSTYPMTDGAQHLEVYEENGQVYLQPDGEMVRISLDWTKPSGYWGYIYTVRMHTSLIHWDQPIGWNSTTPTPQREVLNHPAQEIVAVYYDSGEGEPQLLYGNPVDLSQIGYPHEKDYTLGIAFWTVFLVGCACLIRHASVHHKGEACLGASTVALFSFAYLLGHLCLKGWTFASIETQWELSGILMLMMPLAGVLYLLYQMVRAIWHRRTPQLFAKAVQITQKVQSHLEKRT